MGREVFDSFAGFDDFLVYLGVSAAYLAARAEGLTPVPAAERATELVRSLLAERLT